MQKILVQVFSLDTFNTIILGMSMHIYSRMIWELPTSIWSEDTMTISDKSLFIISSYLMLEVSQKFFLNVVGQTSAKAPVKAQFVPGIVPTPGYVPTPGPATPISDSSLAIRKAPVEKEEEEDTTSGLYLNGGCMSLTNETTGLYLNGGCMSLTNDTTLRKGALEEDSDSEDDSDSEAII